RPLDPAALERIDQRLLVEDADTAGLVELGLLEEHRPGLARVLAEVGLSAAFVAGAEDVLHGVAGPVDRRVVPVPAEPGEGRPGGAGVGGHRAFAVEHEAGEPLARRVELERVGRLAASADRAAVGAGEGLSLVGGLPEP